MPKICYAGMMQYDGDLKLPTRFLVPPPAIDRTLGEYLARMHFRMMDRPTYTVRGSASERDAG